MLEKCFFKKESLSLFLKTDTEELFLMSDGRVFQSVRLPRRKILHRMFSN